MLDNLGRATQGLEDHLLSIAKHVDIFRVVRWCNFRRKFVVRVCDTLGYKTMNVGQRLPTC